MQWLFDLVLNEIKDYYKFYNEVKGIEINELDRFFLKVKLIKEKKLNFRVIVNVITLDFVNDIFEEEEFEVLIFDVYFCII